jgi:hypothetical protein
MSSYLRTLQKRIPKRAGYRRDKTAKVEISRLTGMPVLRPLKRGEGHILTQDGTDTGSRHYPMFLPAATTPLPVEEAA